MLVMGETVGWEMETLPVRMPPITPHIDVIKAIKLCPFSAYLTIIGANSYMKNTPGRRDSVRASRAWSPNSRLYRVTAN